MDRIDGPGPGRVVVALLLGFLLLWGGRDRELSAQLPPDGPPVFANGIFSSEPSSTEGALTLLLPIGARAVSMGRAVTASSGHESAFWNPAGLARIDQGRFVVFRGNHLAGEATALSLILVRQPLGTLTLSYHLLDLGDQDLRDKDGNVIGSFSSRDHLAIASFATRILPTLDGGINFKVYQTRFTCRGQCTDAGITGTAYALDAGVLAEPLGSMPLRIGAMVAHVGTDLQIINVEQADPLPSRARVAASYEVLNHFLQREDMQIWATAELEDQIRDLGSPVLALGAEFVAGQVDQLMVRAGYGQGQSGQPAGMAVGLGIKYQQFEVAIGKSLSGTNLSDQAEPVQVTFGVIF